MLRYTLAATMLLLGAGAAQAGSSYSAALSGGLENPPNASTATGFGSLRIIGNSIAVRIDFTNLSAPAAAGHIHCCVGPEGNAGIAIDLSPPAVATGGFSQLVDLTLASSFRSGFITSSGGTVDLARARLFSAFDNDQAYFNLHNSVFPGGEIRGNIAAVPEPASWAMMIVGFGLVGSAVRRRTAALA